jgi:antitoxin FitA
MAATSIFERTLAPMTGVIRFSIRQVRPSVYVVFENTQGQKARSRPRARFAFVASSDSIDSMATLTIRQLDEKTKTRLRVRAAHHGRSMEEEAREILRSALTASSPGKGNLAEAIRRRFAAFGGLEFELPRRDPMRQAPEFGE